MKKNMVSYKPIKGASKGILFSTMQKDKNGNIIVDKNDFVTVTLLERHGGKIIKE